MIKIGSQQAELIVNITNGTEHNREKTIAEIREVVTRFMGAETDTEFELVLDVLRENAGEWIPFLLFELDREREEKLELQKERDMYKASSEVFYERLKKVEDGRNMLFEKLKVITSMLGGVTFTDGRQWGVYNALCDIVEEIEKELSKND